MDLIITRVVIQDLNEIIDVFTRTYSKEPWNEHWDSLILTERITDFINNKIGLNFCAKDAKGSIVGVIFGRKCYWIKSKEYFIDEFFVDYEYQNKGIGHFMIDEVSTIIKSKGYSCIVLNTEKSFPCEAFYLKKCFIQKESNIFMYKEI